ncbi:MAG: LysE family transporter [Leptospiraceae bacterium]|nr:LysE family transporter [Leptospiraceae bacterium]
MFNFFIAFAVSFLGSIPLGSLNLTALQIYLQRQFSSVVYFSLAASIVELFYSYFAIEGEIFLSTNPFLNQIFSFITIIVFLFLGFINLTAKAKPISSESLHALNILFEPKKFYFFRKGLILSILNPQAIPFWLVLSNFLVNQDLVQFYSTANIIYYTLGVAFGTFFCLLTFALLAGRILKQKQIRMELLNRAIGILFIVIVFFQIGKMVYF